MKSKSKPHFVPPIEQTLLARLHEPNNLFLEATKENIERFNKVLDSVPKKYDWDFLNAEAFQELGRSLLEKLPEGRSEREVYGLYWRDMLGQVEAFSVMTAWRLGDLARSAVWAIRRDDVLCAALMSRAALETAAAYAWLQTEIRPGLEKIAAANTPMLLKFEDQGSIKDLEDKLIRVIYATKLESEEEFYSPTRIGKIIEKIAKHIPDHKIVADTYYMLCEVAHPNWAGRSVYITHVEPGRMPGHEHRTISNAKGSDAIIVLRASVTAISWATGTFSRSCVALQGAVAKMVGHLDRLQIPGSER